METLLPVLVVLVVVGGAMALIGCLSGRQTQEELRGSARAQDPACRRFGLFYADPSDPRVWVPRVHGNGWDPNIATTGGRLVMGALAVLVLTVPVVGLVDALA